VRHEIQLASDLLEVATHGARRDLELAGEVVEGEAFRVPDEERA
jgi:hypothetical protein